MSRRLALAVDSVVLAAALAVVPAALAAAPPDALNYQGILRDAAGDPLDGPHDMVFRFFDADTGGAEILVDEHLAAGTGAVVADAGQFGVALGTGTVLDGAGLGTYTTLAAAFADHTDVWLQIEIDGGSGIETLSPRVQVRSSAYALNASRLGGVEASGFIDASSLPQVKTGNLTVNQLTSTGDKLTFGSGGRIEGFGGQIKLGGLPVQVEQDLDVNGNDITFGAAGAVIQASPTSVLVQAGDANTDTLILRAGNDETDGQISVFGDGIMKLRAGDGTFNFLNGSGGSRAILDGTGLDLANDLVVGGDDITFGTPGARVQALSTSLFLTAGDQDTDDLVLRAGNSATDGEIVILGGQHTEFRAGSGEFLFKNGIGAVIADISSGGTLSLGGSLGAQGGVNLSGGPLDVNSDQITFGQPGAAIDVTSNQLVIQAGDVSTDNLVLRAGATGVDGEILLFGDKQIQFSAGNGEYQFRNSSQVATATLSNGGDLDIEGSLDVLEVLRVGNSASPFLGPSTFGPGVSDAPEVSGVKDIYVAGDIELDEKLFLNGTIYMDDDGPDGDQNIRFYDSGNRDNEFIRWEDAADRFRISDDLKIEATALEGRDAGNFEVISTSSLHLVADVNVRSMIDDDATTSTGVAAWYSNGSFNTASQLAELQEDGDLRIGGTLSQNVAFDLAESFLASEPLEPGEVVALDPARPGAVRRATGTDDSLVLGVISSHPGMLLGSAPFDPDSLAEVWGADEAAVFEVERGRLRRDVLEANPDLQDRLDEILTLQTATATATLDGGPDPDTGAAPVLTGEGAPGVPDGAGDLPASAQDDPAELLRELEDRLTSLALERFHAERTVPVALAGRVPVRVDASAGGILPGDSLAAGPVPGTATRAEEGAVVIGTALEGLRNGTGTILAFVHRGGPATVVASSSGATDGESTGAGPEVLPEVQTAGHLQLVLDANADDEARLSVFRDGERTLESEVFRVDEEGNVFARGAFRPASMDVAEYFPTSGHIVAGDVLCVAVDAPGSYEPCREANAAAVVGVVAASPGVLLGGDVSRIVAVDAELAAELERAREFDDREAEAAIWSRLQDAFLAGHAPVAMTGTVDVRVDAGYGAVRPGDLLVASPTPGHAMRGDDPRPGTVVGKALGALDAGTGTLRMLVMLR